MVSENKALKLNFPKKTQQQQQQQKSNDIFMIKTD